MSTLSSLDSILASWPGSSLRLVVGSDVIWSHGDQDHVVPIASLTKPLFATAVLIAIEEGSLDLDSSAELDDAPQATVRHLLSHASGVSPDGPQVLAAPGTRRIYSNYGFELLGDLLADGSGLSAQRYLFEAVLSPLGMDSTTMAGSPAHSASSNCADLARWVNELLRPTLFDSSSVAAAFSPQFGDIDGVLPGFGTQRPNPWGLGFEVRGAKSPHWTSENNSAQTVGHFGRSGTFVWIEPASGACLIGLGETVFDRWAVDLWPALSTLALDLL